MGAHEEPEQKVLFRTDLVDLITPEDVLKMGFANQHSFSADPVFSKTGVGYLTPTIDEDRAREETQLAKFQKTLLERLRLKQALTELKRIAISNVEHAQKRVDKIVETLEMLRKAHLEERHRKIVVHSIHHEGIRAYQQFDMALSRILKLNGVRIKREPHPDELLNRAEMAGIKEVESMREYRRLIPEDVPGAEVVNLEANAQVLCSMWPGIKQTLIAAIEGITEIVPRFWVDLPRFEEALGVAKAAAKYLKEDEGAQRVFLFGSLSMGPEHFDPDYSDIDLAFDRIKDKKDYQVTWEVKDLFPPFTIDAWPLERFPEKLREMICREGIPL